jgi:hypothetical protein
VSQSSNLLNLGGGNTQFIGAQRVRWKEKNTHLIASAVNNNYLEKPFKRNEVTRYTY